jgi:exodeoxyribonuclease VII large subunit
VVQGSEGPAALCEGLRLANDASGADVVIVARGGGALEDLAAFNAESVARAVAGSRLPVISAVGHETDVTLADLAADLRVPTPTAAAELVVARREELAGRLSHAAARAGWVFRSRIQAARLKCEGLWRRQALAHPRSLLERRRARLEAVNGRLFRARELALRRSREQLASAVGRLEGVNPLATLARGFGAVSRLPDGSRLDRVAGLAPGEGVRVRMADGVFEARVLTVEAKESP